MAFLYPWSLNRKLHCIIIQCFGLILIIASYLLISKRYLSWPGYIALIPVIGAYLIIVSIYQSNFLISNSIFNYIGKWSYSLMYGIGH